MPGKQSASEPAIWSEVLLEESGGFSGLFRGARLVRADLDEQSIVLVSRLLKRLAREGNVPLLPYPDGQLLRLRLKQGNDFLTMAFDTSDLPKAMSELLLLAPLRPMPPP